MEIKFSTFRSDINQENRLTSFSRKFINSINKELGTKLIYSNDISDYRCDLKLIYIESGGSEGFFLRDFKKLKKPYIFLTSGDNNSLAASLEILHFLKIRHLDGEIIHGDIKYIASRIKTLCKLKK